MKKIKNNQQGFSLLLTVLILASLMILTLTISDVVLRVGKSAESIGNSEVAYFAAETAVERALFQIEKNYSMADLTVSTPQNMSTTNATWTRTVVQNNAFDVSCADLGNNEGLCINNPGIISASNPLIVKLNSGSSFQIDLRYSAMETPNNLKIEWSGGTAKVIGVNNDGVQTVSTTPGMDHEVEKNYRIVNTTAGSGLMVFELKPSATNLATSITVTGIGNYKNSQRVLEVEKKVWQIY
ncbi:MAG TPA: hypothetical protein PLK76_00085 [bacterium]|nr:hypothetical protein [bacterium]